ncbi:MAG: AsmA family protein [Paludibacteraceae bacterium]|nr:AsmA family protein [Paludibacteraceae bacterium]
MKALKIIGWTLLSIVLLVVVVVTIACYVVFTPERLTPIAREAADKFITCEHEIGEVDLTFFSTFPRFGLRADGLLIINPKAGSPNDTVVAAKHLTATVDVVEFLSRKNLHVHEAILDGASVCFYIASDGTTNLDGAFVTSPDTVEQEEDTTAFSLPFDQLRVDGLRLKAEAITFVDAKDTISASLGRTEVRAEAKDWDDMVVVLDARDVCAALKGDVYADSLHIQLDAPMAVDLDKMHFAFDKARLAVNEFALRLSGTADIQESIGVDMSLETEDRWQIKSLLALVPPRFASMLKDLDVDGRVQLGATAKGYVREKELPLVNAHLSLINGEGKYKPLPYTLRDIQLDADAMLNLNEGETSGVTINRLSAKTKQSQLSAKGQIDDLLQDMLLNLKVSLDANLPDFAYFLPKEMTLDGRAKGDAAIKIRLSSLTKMQLEKGKIRADLDLTNIHYAMDSMVANLPQTHAVLQLPNPKPSHRKLTWVRIDLTTDKVDFEMAMPLKADLGKSDVQLEAGNVLSKDPVLYAAVGLQTRDNVHVTMDTIVADIKAPDLSAYAEYDTKKKTTPRLEADILAAGLNAKMGNELQAQTQKIGLSAKAWYNSKGENALLKWNPRLKINLANGKLSMPNMLPEPVVIPSIDFSYSNREMNIANSRIELGRSDLNIKGNVRNIGKWLREKAVLEGQLDIVSDHCDANQLMAWFSADSGSEEEAKPEEATATEQSSEKSESDPFLVPTDVNLAIKTHMREVEVFNQVAKDLKGGLYINDGTLILDEMGFVCRAAKLQLTAMYRTPRRNHIYLGMDYHMIDVDIDELLTMIPNLEEMVPMLSSFKGAAEFHLAAETYLNSQYKPKMSTLRGAASLTGKDLVVLDGETFSTISKLLLFNKKTENKIDSINAEMTIYKNEIDIYPLCVQMDNYMVAMGGRHNTDMTFDYDINVLSPIYLGVNVSGNMDDLKIKLAKCKFAQDFKPHWYQKVDNQSRELRERIKKSMEKNVRIK